jgi:hypothetical protein
LSPSAIPVVLHSSSPSREPTLSPSGDPSKPPSGLPSLSPSAEPTLSPSGDPSSQPSSLPSLRPSAVPVVLHSSSPSVKPTSSMAPTWKRTSLQELDLCKLYGVETSQSFFVIAFQRKPQRMQLALDPI